MAISLSKGGNVSLSKEDPTLDEIMIGLGWDARSTDWKSVSETAKAPPSDETRHLTQVILSWQDAWRDVAMDQPELPLVRRQLARIDPDRKVLAAALEWHNTRTRTEIEGDNAEQRFSQVRQVGERQCERDHQPA